VSRVGKQTRRPGPLTASAVLLALLAGGCTGPAPRTISAAALESAPPRRPDGAQRCIVTQASALRHLYQPLARRFGLIQIRTPKDWEVLASVAPVRGPCPDLSRGTLVGLLSETGTPLDGEWPLRWYAVRVHDGAGLLEASFHAGSFLPDGATYLETAYVPDLLAVLVVSVDGTWYYPAAPGETEPLAVNTSDTTGASLAIMP
jgi:hypothetical protein